MAKNKTTETENSVTNFLSNIQDETKRDDSYEMIGIMEEVTGHPAKMWGPSIIGFGSYHYTYDSGHEGDAPVIGFSPRAAAITLYLEVEFPRKDELLASLGKHKIGKGCVYVKNLTDIDQRVLREVISESVRYTRNKYLS